MKPFFKEVFRTPATENLVDDAIEANQTADTIVAEQVQQNVDFEAEIAKLKGEEPAAEQPEQTETQEAEPTGEELEGEPTPTEEVQTEEPTSEEPVESEQEQEVEIEEVEVDTQGQEQVVDAPAQAATESLLMVALSLEKLTQAHETGVIGERQLSLFKLGLESHYRNARIAVPASVSRESDEPTTSMGRLKYAGGKVKDFIKQVLAKVREYLSKVKVWIMDFIKNTKEIFGKFEVNTDGLIKRIKYVKANQRADKEVEKYRQDNPIAPIASIVFDGKTDLDAVKTGVTAMGVINRGIANFIVNENGVQLIARGLMDVASAYGRGEQPDYSDTIMTAEKSFMLKGSTSIFGPNRDVFNNLSLGKEANSMQELVVAKQLGGATYKWNLSAGAVDNIDAAINTNYKYNFQLEVFKQDTPPQYLQSTEECAQVMTFVIDLIKSKEALDQASKSLMTIQDRVRDVVPQVQEYFDKNDEMDDETKIKVITYVSTVQNSIAQIGLNSITKQTHHLGGVISGLQRWVSLSLNALDGTYNPVVLAKK